MTLVQEFFFDNPVDHQPQWCKVTIDVKYATWLGMDAELRPRPLFKNFLERAGTPRQGQEGIRKVRHFLFALVH